MIRDNQKPDGASRGLFRLPSKDEQLQLQNTDTLMKTNLLQLQSKELLSEVSTNGQLEKKKMSVWLESVMLQLRDGGGLAGTKITASWLRDNAGITLGGHGEASECSGGNAESSLIFEPPAAVETVGSFVLKTSTTPFLNIDVAVEMPSGCFEAKDILNHGYFTKRKLFVGALWSIIKSNQHQNPCSISVGLFKGDSRKPILLLRPTKSKSMVTIRIIPVLPNNVFKLKQLRLEKNNVRPESWLKAVQDGKKTKTVSALDPSSLAGTPNYNQSILEDISVRTQFKILSQTLQACPVARDIVVLLKVWLTQRSMRFTQDNLDSHYATLLVAYLVQVKKITSLMTPLSGFQAILRFFTDSTFETTAHDFLSTLAGKKSAPETASPLVLTHPVADLSGGQDEKREVFHFNCMWRVTSSCLDDLVEEARKSLRCIESNSRDAFYRLFMMKSSFYDRHDVFFHVPFQDSFFANMKTDCPSSHINVDIFPQLMTELKDSLCDQPPSDFLADKIVSTVKHALGDRVTAARVTRMNSSDSIFFPEWNEPTLTCQLSLGLTLGLILHKDLSHRRVERGPSAESTDDCENFRRFWGPLKSKLRRFQDGSIIEAVVWDDNKDRSSKLKSGCVPRGERIVEEVVRHVLGRHAPIPSGLLGEHLVCKASLLEQVFLPAPGIIADDSSESASFDADTLARKAIEALDSLRSILISKLKELPLVIENVMGASPALRYTAFIPPRQHPLLLKELMRSLSGTEISLLATPLTIVAKIDSGGKWPTEADAISYVKTALYLRIGELLAAKFRLHSVPHREYLDISMDGFIFRLQLFACLEVERLSSVDLKKVIRNGTIAPLHHSAVKALHGHFPSFGNAVRLLSRWCDGNYFTGLLSHDVLELLTASCYLDPEFAVAPSSPTAGFRRALNKLCSHDWDNSPLLIDFAGDMTISDNVRINSYFRKIRDGRAGPSMYMVSSCDKVANYEVSVEAPSNVVLRLIVTAAARSLSSLKFWTQDDGSVGDSHVYAIMDSSAVASFSNVTIPFSKALFASKRTSGLGFWDGTRGPPFARLKVFSNMSSREAGLSNLIVKAGSTPCTVQEEVVANLRSQFDDFALVFWNGLDGREVNLVWKPAAFLPEKFKILSSTNRIATAGTAATSQDSLSSVLNIAEIVIKMVAVGDGAFDASGLRFH